MAFGKFGRYHPDGVEVHPEPLDLVELLRGEVETLAAGAGAQHRLRLDTPGGTCQLVTDRQHVRYILVNLLENAVKYSAPGTEVAVELAAEGDDVRVSVSDEGIGIPDAELQELWSPFYRASNVEGRPGTGMGLAIAKRSAGLIGARLSVDTRLGEGTTFTVFLRRSMPGHRLQ